MAGKTRPRVIAIEEHYFDPAVIERMRPGDAAMAPFIRDRLLDVGAGRIKAMDDAGIDVQVLSHNAPSTQRMDAETAIPVAKAANDRLREICKSFPGRFEGFAALPTADPKAAADELERAVTKLGMKGAMVHGLCNGVFFDDKRFWPIFERARALDVPLYLHPGPPHPAVVEAYYKDYVEKFPSILNAAWGYTVETATQGVRLVLSGVFDAYPGVKVILGHLGESLPFSLWRIDHSLARPGQQSVAFRDTFCEHVWITTSGNFSTPALLCCIQEMGAERILFSVDWPYVENKLGTAWMDDLMLNAEDKAKMLHKNAETLLKL